MSKTLGVRFDQDCLVAAVVDASGSRPRLCEFLLERGSGRQQAMKAFVARHRLDPRRVAASVPAHGNYLCKFSVDLTDEEEIAQAVHYEAEPHITTHPIDDLVVDFHILKSGRARTRLLVGAAKKAVIEHTLSWCEDSGIFPMVLEMDVTALHHAAQAAGMGRDHAALILDLNPRFCNMLLVDRGDIADARSMPLMIETVREGMLADLEDTAELSLDHGASAPLTPARRERIFHRLGEEIKRMIFTSPPQIYVCGNEELVQGFPEFLLKNYGLRASVWPLAYVEVAGHIPEFLLPHAHAAIGLALKAAGRTRGGYDLRKSEFQYRHGFEIVKKPLAMAATLLLLLFAGGILRQQRTLGEMREAYSKLGLRAEEIHDRAGLKEGILGEDPLGRLESLKCALETKIQDGGNVPVPMSALVKWKDAAETISSLKGEYLYTIESTIIKGDEVWLEGRVESLVCFDAWMGSLRKLPWVDGKDGGARLFSFEEIDRPENGRLKLRYRFRMETKN